MTMASATTTALLLTFIGAAGTALGGLAVVIQPNMSFRRLGVLQVESKQDAFGIATMTWRCIARALALQFLTGLMLCISLVDLLPASIEAVGFAAGSFFFYVGVLFFMAVVALIPEPDASLIAVQAGESDPDTQEGKEAKKKRRQVLLSGLVTALGIALHNFPEGVAVFLASMKSKAVGASLAAAIALHNVPEGVAVALPVYFATGSRWQGFLYAAVSGLAEPVGVVVLGVLLPMRLDDRVVESMLAAVAGIMAFLTLHELLPLSLEHAGRSLCTVAVFSGMAIMSANLWLLDHWISPGGH